jgi:hypothetical protein
MIKSLINSMHGLRPLSTKGFNPSDNIYYVNFQLSHAQHRVTHQVLPSMISSTQGYLCHIKGVGGSGWQGGNGLPICTAGRIKRVP